MNVGQDSDFSREQFVLRYNADLANDLGNLVNRTLNMTHRFAGGIVPAAESAEEPETQLHALWESTRTEFLRLFEGFQFHTALERLFVFVKSINAYIEKRAPWKLGKSADPADRARLNTALASMAESLRLSACALRPVMPGAADKICGVLGGPKGQNWIEELNWGSSLAGARVSEALVLFPRAQNAPAAPAKA